MNPNIIQGGETFAFPVTSIRTIQWHVDMAGEETELSEIAVRKLDKVYNAGSLAKYFSEQGDKFLSPTYEVFFDADSWDLFCADFYKRNQIDIRGHLGFKSQEDKHLFEKHLSSGRYSFVCFSGNHRFYAQCNVYDFQCALLKADKAEGDKKAKGLVSKFKYATCRIFCGVARCGVAFESCAR